MKKETVKVEKQLLAKLKLVAAMSQEINDHMQSKGSLDVDTYLSIAAKHGAIRAI